MRKHAYTRGIWGHAPPEKNFKLGALRSLLRPYLYSNLYLDSMPLEYRTQVFLECRLPCSGITEPSLHMFQQRGMVKKITIPDSWKGGALKGKSLPRGGHVPLVQKKKRMLLWLRFPAITNDGRNTNVFHQACYKSL